jgi:CheY-like chemotaxis protein
MMPVTKALLVEDEFLIAADMEAILRDMGFEPLIAASVPDALRILAEGGVGVAVLDYRLGNTDTESVGAKLREQRIPFALCSGSTPDQTGSAFHGVPFVSKPYTDQVFRQVVRSLVTPDAIV